MRPSEIARRRILTMTSGGDGFTTASFIKELEGKTSKNTVMKVLKELENKTLKRRLNDGRLLWFSVKIPSRDLNSRVIETVSKLRARHFSEPTIDEVALNAGETSKVIRKVLYQLAPQTNWHPPTSGEMADRVSNKERGLKPAGFIMFQKKKRQKRFKTKQQRALFESWMSYAKDKEDFSTKCAHDCIKFYPDLVPVIKPGNGRHVLFNVYWSVALKEDLLDAFFRNLQFKEKPVPFRYIWKNRRVLSNKKIDPRSHSRKAL